MENSQGATRQPLSARNKDVLLDYAKGIEQKMNPTQETLITSISKTIFSKLPGAKQIGSWVGWAVAQSHASGVTNDLITLAFNHVAPIPYKKPTLSEKCYNAFIGVAMPTAEETAKLLITPKLLPIITICFSTGGGYALPAAIALATALTKRVMSDPNSKYDLNNLPKLNELIFLTADGPIDANGIALTKTDIEDLRTAANKLNIAYQLLNCSREDLDQLMNKYFKYEKADGTIAQWGVYPDGTELTEKEYNTIELGILRLRGTNPTGESLNEMIELLAKHLPMMSLEPVEEDFDNDWILIEDEAKTPTAKVEDPLAKLEIPVESHAENRSIDEPVVRPEAAPIPAENKSVDSDKP